MTCSFEGFLVRYCNQLTRTGKRVRSIAKLASRLQEHPRAYEPVTVLAALWGRGDILLASVEDPVRRRGCVAFLDGFATFGGDLVAYLEELGRKEPRERHYRVLEAWRAESEQGEADDALKADVARAMSKVIGRIGVCEAARACGVNKGNLWAFAQGDVSKMSKTSALSALVALRKADANSAQG